MSKILEKLQRISSGRSQPMGFRAAATIVKGPSMVLIAALNKGDAASAGESADAVLFPGGKLKEGSLGKIVASLGDLPWGVSVEEATGEELSQLKEMGCDFLVFNAARAPLALLREEEMGKIVEIEPSLADGLVRAIEQLPIDAVLIGEEGELSIHRLMVCQRLANLVRKPLVALAPIAMSQEELQGLFEAGVVGVVVKLEGSAEELSKLRQAIEGLPSFRRRKARVQPLLPYAVEEITEPEEEY
ncbi:MAG: hypothetical protein ACE5IE_04595 [Dehalococcoidia bacterium]